MAARRLEQFVKKALPTDVQLAMGILGSAQAPKNVTKNVIRGIALPAGLVNVKVCPVAEYGQD